MNVTVKGLLNHAFKEMLILRFNLAVTVGALQAEEVRVYEPRIGAEVAGKKNLLLLPLLPPPPPPPLLPTHIKKPKEKEKKDSRTKKNN